MVRDSLLTKFVTYHIDEILSEHTLSWFSPTGKSHPHNLLTIIMLWISYADINTGEVNILSLYDKTDAYFVD